MYSYEIPKKLFYPKTVFYEDRIVFYHDGYEVTVGTNEIERIEYKKPTLWNYIWAWGGTFPGRMEIYLKDRGSSLLNCTSNKTTYLVKISYKDIFKLPEFYKQKMGLCD